MNYKQSLSYLNSFINYEKTPPASHAELNLERMRHGLEVLGHPENNFFPILIAGTVGKGSTGYFLEQILESAQISSGFYHSPHIDDIRERIRVRGEMLPEKKWAAALTQIQKLLKQKPFPKKLGIPTFFEMLTLLAIWIYAQEGLRAGIFEIGMGGRLDATNILNAPLCVLTRIDFDHQAFLGNTLTAIAREKAGIIKSARVVVAMPQDSKVIRVFKSALSKKARLIISKPISFQPGLLGEFQKQNAGAAAFAARALRDQFDFSISENAVHSGLRQSAWAGRLEKVRVKSREIMMDAAHNPAGCRELVKVLSGMKKKPSCLLFSALRDKKSAEMLQILAALQVPVIVTPLKHPRTKQLANLAAEAEAFFDRIVPAKDTKHALQLLMKNTKPGALSVVTGSFYLLGEVRKSLRG